MGVLSARGSLAEVTGSHAARFSDQRRYPGNHPTALVACRLSALVFGLSLVGARQDGGDSAWLLDDVGTTPRQGFGGQR